MSSVLSATFFGMVVVGCAPLSVAETTRAPSAASAAPVRTAQIPLPDPALLTPQPAPNCTYRGPAGTPEEQRQRLDFEQQCYRQAEAIARARLQRLQESVGETIKAVKRRSR